jgi:uncharacterized SAM-binding protein YcdF (DUF218 family)
LVIVIRITVVAVLSVLAISFFGFAGYDKPKDLTRIETAIVFTGADERVRVGVELLKAGLVKRLYISGSNPNAGIWSLNYFEKKFGNGEGNMRPLLECCIQFGALAETTFQNALETRCWVENRKLSGPILLITSSRHMARARAALGHQLPMVEIVPYPVPEEEDRVNTSERLRQRTIDYMKYLATVALMALPSWLIPPALYGPFYKGCPAGAQKQASFPAGSERTVFLS